MAFLSELSQKPQFTIKKASFQTGIPSVTIRAWERRYNLLAPQRSGSNYRLYSERDIAILRWVKNQVDSDIPVSHAVTDFKDKVDRGEWITIRPLEEQPAGSDTSLASAEYARLLYRALRQHDEETAASTLQEARSCFSLMTLCTEVITLCLVDIGEAWYRGEIRVATEHFASTFLRGWLLNLLQNSPSRRGAPYILTGCGPMEFHEIGSIMLALLLRREGYRVEYLGLDVPLDDLVSYAGEERPALICLSASMESNALELKNVQRDLNRLKKPPIFGYGGRAFNRQPELRNKTPGLFLGESYPDALRNIHQLIKIA